AVEKLHGVKKRLQSVQPSSVTEQQLEQKLAPTLERLDNVSAQLEGIQDVVEGTGASIENTTRMMEEEHDRMIMALRAEIVTAVDSGQEGQEPRAA
ncbi:hypothetical protein OFM52_29915, partial [Escherichia coli]|nr:hypothetical protein [Escherichia coli]